MDNKLMAKAQAIEESAVQLEENYKKQIALLHDMIKATRMQAIWPEAFHNGGTCKLHFSTLAMPNGRDHGIVSAELVSADGSFYPLKVNELIVLIDIGGKEGKEIHPNFSSGLE